MPLQNKKSTATIITPQEFSGSNTLEKYDQGVYINTVNSLFGSSVVKIRPNNDFLKIRSGKKYVALEGAYDDIESPSSVIFSGTSLSGDPVYHPSLVYLDQSKGGVGYNKITGYNIAPSHFILRNEYGQPNTHQDGTPFIEISIFPSGSLDPLYMMHTEYNNRVFPQEIVNSTDATSIDGAIDQFGVRDEVIRSYTEIPYRFKGIKSDLCNVDLFLRSIVISEEVPLIFTRVNDLNQALSGIEPYLDAGDEFGLDDLVGLSTSSCGPVSGFGYVNEPNSKILGFTDTSDNESAARLISGSEIASGVLSMNCGYPTHSSLRINHVSLARGFDYIGSQYGFDSVAYGGLIKI